MQSQKLITSGGGGKNHSSPPARSARSIERRGCQPNSFGSKAAAGMSQTTTKTPIEKGVPANDISTRSAEGLISSLSKFVNKEIGASRSTAQIVESLLWPFVVHRSLRKGEWFEPREWSRFRTSACDMGRRIVSHEDEENHEQTFCKYWLDYHLCRFTGDPNLPEKADWIVKPLFSGWMARCIARALANRRSASSASFFYSLQKGTKLMWPEMSELRKALALDTHRKRLSEPHGFCPEDLLNEIRSTSQFVANRSITKLRSVKFLPSGSACLQASRRQGGALSMFSPLQIPPDFFADAVETPHLILTDVEGDRYFYSSPEADSASKMGRLLQLNSRLNEWRQSSFEQSLDISVSTLLKDYHSPSLDRSKQSEILDVSILPIPEPGKFRIISKGDGHLYSALQPLQGVMIDCWKTHRASSMRDENLLEKINHISERACEFSHWCSVDYEAATDLLKRDGTIAAFSGFQGHPLAALGLVSLQDGRAHYPELGVKGELGYREAVTVDIMDAQLMGHPLSFPLLCIINLSVYRHAISLWLRSRRRKGAKRSDLLRWGQVMRANVLVNGDDMVFKCFEDFLPIFRMTALSAGLKISQGKNYLSIDVAMINSQFYVSDHKGQMHRRGYLNLRIIRGNNIKTGDSRALPNHVGPELNRMCEYYPQSRCALPSAFRRWNFHFSGHFVPNWFLPTHLGGYGVDPALASCNSRITKIQRIVAAHFVNDPSLCLFRRPGITHHSVRFVSSLMEWKMRPGAYVADWNETSETADWLGRICYAARASHPFQLPKSQERDHQIACFLGEADKVILIRLARKYRLKPLSDQGIEKYRFVQFFSSLLPPCPDLEEIHVPDSFDRARGHLRLIDIFMGFRSLKVQNGVPMTDHEELNSSVLTKMPRDYTAPPHESTCNCYDCGILHGLCPEDCCMISDRLWGNSEDENEMDSPPFVAGVSHTRNDKESEQQKFWVPVQGILVANQDCHGGHASASSPFGQSV